MPRSLSTALTLTLFAVPAVASAELELPQPSPAAETTQRVGMVDISVTYSSPGVKGRKIWGALVPYDKMWRAGANKSTVITFAQDVKFGGKDVKAGSYALYTLPAKKGWMVILNGQTEAWGTGNYAKDKEVLRVKAKTTKIAHRERLAYIFSNTTDSETRLDLEWEKLRISVPISVDTKKHAIAAIDKSLGRTWVEYARAAEFLLKNGDAKKALTYAEGSTNMRKHWFNHWVKAQVLAGLGRTADAIAAAQEADKLGADNNGYLNNAQKDVKAKIAEWKKGNKS